MFFLALQFQEKVDARDLRRIFPRAHLEVVRTTYERLVSYCKKEGHYSEWRKKEHQGALVFQKRNSLR
jgi:hypothetical protein